MAREAARSGCRAGLELLARSTLDIDALRLEAVDQLRRTIGFELWGVPLVDPDTLIANRVVVSDAPPWGPRLPERWILDQTIREINSRAVLARGPDHVGVLSAATSGDLARCYRWREMGQPIGMGDELRAAVVDDHGCWGSFELFRASDDRTFDSDDALLLRDAGRILAPAFRRSRLPPPATDASDPAETGVLLIDNELRPGGVTQAARSWFGLLDAGQKSERTPLPIHVYGVVGRLFAAEAGDDPHRPPRVRLRTNAGRWAIVEAARLDNTADIVAVTVRSAQPGDVLTLVCRAYGLTARERELVALVADGLDTREVAQRMFISVYTVKDHLKSVFGKLGIRSRRELVTGVLGQAG